LVPYQPEPWHDFFLTVGGGAAALTGLVVVAMSMHLEMIRTDPALRHRARMILATLAGVFVRCSLALMANQDGRSVAVDLFVVCLVLTIANLLSYAPVAKTPAAHRSSLLRTIGGTTGYGVEMLGAGLLFFGAGWGLNVAAVAMVVSLGLTISSSWLLLMGVQEDTPPAA
jgi:hypothetical protein